MRRRYQTKAFLLLPLVFNSGMVISLALGGALAEPAKNLPSLFGPGGLLNLSGGPNGVEWLLAYPFALPALMNAFVLGVALILATLFLRETLPGMESAVDPGLRLGSALHRLVLKILGQRDHGAYTEVKDEESLSEPSSAIEQPEAKLPPDEQGPKPPQLPFRKIWTRNVLASTVAFGLLPLHNAAFMHIFPIFLSTPSADNSHATLVAFAGGLGLTSSTIGLWLSAFGTVGILLQLFIYPRLQSRIGTLGVFRIALLLFPAVYAVAPYLSLLPPNGILRWLGLGVVICGQIAARTMAIPSTVILLTEAAPAKTVLGTVHGAGNTIASLARAIGPAVGGVVFGWGVHAGIIGMVWWLYLVCVSLLALIWTIWMQQPDG
jgi:MFS family permease